MLLVLQKDRGYFTDTILYSFIVQGNQEWSLSKREL